MDALRIRRDVLRATVSGTMAILDALLRSQAATALDRRNVLDLILQDQVSLHQLDVQVQVNLKGKEFDADVLQAIDYDERICALRTRVRFSASHGSSASPVLKPQAALFTTRIASSTIRSRPEEARRTMVPGDLPPGREMTAAQVEQGNGDGGASAFQDAKPDTEVLSQRERLKERRSLAASVTAVSGKPQGHSREIGIANAAIVSERAEQPCYGSPTVSLGPATETRFVQKVNSLQEITKRLLLRRYLSELRRRKRAPAALVQARWGGILNKSFDGDYPFFNKSKVAAKGSIQ